QFVGLEIHDRKCASSSVLATIGIVLAVRAITALGADGTVLQQSGGQHVIVTDDDGPLRMTLELDEEIVSGLRIEVGNARFRVLLGELLHLVDRARGLPARFALAFAAWRCRGGVCNSTCLALDSFSSWHNAIVSAIVDRCGSLGGGGIGGCIH